MSTTTPEADTGAGPVAPDGIWPILLCDDAPAVLRFAVDVLGFRERLVVPGADEGVIEHSQLVWPEGGVVSISTAGRENARVTGASGGAALYAVTRDPRAVYERCRAAGASFVVELIEPEYDEGGSVFTVLDPEGNMWSFGTYAGET